MSTQSDTSKSGTATRPAPTSPARSRFGPVPPSLTEEAGTSYTPGSTGPGRHRATSTDAESALDCDFELQMSADDQHPVGIICHTHKWVGDIH